MENLSFYVEKCRCCLSCIDGDVNSIPITTVIENQFYYLVSLELRSSSLLSSRICVDCNDKLSAFCVFKGEISSKQRSLYEMLNEMKIREQIEELEPGFEDPDNCFDDLKPPKFEPELDIKTETEFSVCKISEDFEAVDYVNNADTHLNFDQCDSETPTYSPKSKRRKRKDPFRNASETFEKKSCPFCQKYFSDAKKVKLHVQRVHKQIKNHKCDECEYRAHTKWDILRHIKTNHMPQDSDPKDLRICPDCGKVLKGNNHLNFHIKTKHLKLTKYACDMCDFRSYGKYEIRSHIEIHHLPLELRKGFPCDLCPSVLTTAMSLKTHKTHKHSGLRPHQCFCGKSYALRETLKSHIRNVHNGERKYKCPHQDCGKGFNSNPRLRDHINNNHGTKQEIPCEKCGKTFNSMRNLQTHMIYHLPPTLKCNYCQKLFYIKKNLREHSESVHLGITYSCELCNRSFQSTSGLRRHAKSHVKD